MKVSLLIRAGLPAPLRVKVVQPRARVQCIFGMGCEGRGMDGPWRLRGAHPRFIRDQRHGSKTGKIAMKTGCFASAAIAGLLLWAPAQAATPEWSTILLEKIVNRTPDQVWAKVGGYCSIQQWLKLDSCVVTSGNGVSVGTNRRLNGKTDEMIVAQTPYSYTYAQPTSPIFYHGTLSVEPMDRGAHAKIVYTLFYDAGPLTTPQARDADRAARSKRFGEALDTMKQMAEAQ
jgi:hypothetical protein